MITSQQIVFKNRIVGKGLGPHSTSPGQNPDPPPELVFIFPLESILVLD